jgi:hypothetical protein
MLCISTPEMGEDQLLQYLDGNASANVKEHVSNCPYCRKRVEELQALQLGLLDRLFRATCPSSDELGEYFLGMLSAERSSAIAVHVSCCPHCEQELAQLSGFLATTVTPEESAPTEAVLDRIKVIIGRLIDSTTGLGSTGAFGFTQAYAGIRGEEEGPLIYQANGGQVILEFQEDTEYPGRKSLFGLISGFEQSTLMVQLWAEDGSLRAAHVDEIGNFVFSSLTPGVYKLTVITKDVEIHIPKLQIDSIADH